MTQVINTGGDDSGAGVVVGILVAVVLAIGIYVFAVRNGNVDSVNTPDVNIEMPAAPSAPDANPAN